MSDLDNLRVRIADAIYKNQDVVVGDAGEIFGDAAQAVIDEFGLTVEERIDEPGKRGINPVRRVVGKWAKQ